jgi:dTDP-4-dehydrorhamnose reductase
VYGRSKAEAEQRVLERMEQALVVRTSAFFGPVDVYNFVTLALRELARGRPYRAASDAVVSPTYVPHLVDATLDLLIDGASGLFHLANVGAVSWAELATKAAEMAKLPGELIEACSMHELPSRARRPPYSALGSARSSIMPSLEEGLARYVHAAGLAS